MAKARVAAEFQINQGNKKGKKYFPMCDRVREHCQFEERAEARGLHSVVVCSAELSNVKMAIYRGQLDPKAQPRNCRINEDAV